jgi:hypothetical protein
MNQALQSELHKRIEAFASDITAVLQRAVADAVAQALRGTSSVTFAGPRARGGRAGSKGAGRTAGAKSASRRMNLSAADLYAELVRDGGRNIEKIAEALQTSTSVVGPLLKALLAEGRVRRTGQARGTKYFAVAGRAPGSAPSPTRRSQGSKPAKRAKKSAQGATRNTKKESASKPRPRPDALAAKPATATTATATTTTEPENLGMVAGGEGKNPEGTVTG